MLPRRGRPAVQPRGLERDSPVDPHQRMAGQPRRAAPLGGAGRLRQGERGPRHHGLSPLVERRRGVDVHVADTDAITLAHLDDLEPQLDRLCAHHDALRAGFEDRKSVV